MVKLVSHKQVFNLPVSQNARPRAVALAVASYTEDDKITKNTVVSNAKTFGVTKQSEPSIMQVIILK